MQKPQKKHLQKNISRLLFFVFSFSFFNLNQGTALPFQAANNIAVGSEPISITSADFDHDSDNDVAVANKSGNSVSILLNNGNGVLTLNNTISVGSVPNSIIAGDFNRDGDIDLATANQLSSNISLLFGNGSGMFSAPSDIATLTGHDAITAGDFNQDGSLDIAVTNSNDATDFSVLLGDGIGGFGAETSFGTGSGNYNGIITEDFDDDGDLDIALALTSGTGGFLVYLGANDGTFTSNGSYAAGVTYSSVITADFNDDGNLDLAGTNSSNAVTVLSGNGDGTFGSGIDYGVGSNPTSVTSNDFDHDGDLDLAVTNSGDNNISILLNDNFTGFISDPTTVAAGTTPVAILSEDLNDDGEKDLVIANSGSNDIAVVLDTIFTGTGNLRAPVEYLTGGQTFSLTGGDFNKDGKYDLIAGNLNTGDFSFMPGNGSGEFNTSNIFTGFGPPLYLQTADINRDGNLDLAVSYFFGVGILLGDGAGNFIEADLLPHQFMYSFEIADFSRDGYPDIVIFDYNDDAVIVYYGDGTGFFPANNIYTVEDHNLHGSTGDVDLDGDIDIISASDSTNNISVLLNDGTGNFGLPAIFAAGIGAAMNAIADFNGDSLPDVVVLNSNDEISILTGNGDGTFNAAVTYAVGHTFSDVIAVADINQDNDLDVVVSSENNPQSLSILFGIGDGTFDSPITKNIFSIEDHIVADVNEDAALDVILARDHNLYVLLGDGITPTLTEITPVSDPTNDTTPDYTFSTDEAGTITYGGDCSSATTNAAVGNNTITFNTLAEGLHDNCTIILTDEAGNASSQLHVTAFTIDTIAPVISEQTTVLTPNPDTTPAYTFLSSEAGTITYGGSCAGVTTAAVFGANTIDFGPLVSGDYNDCTLTVTDAAGNLSNVLDVLDFTIDADSPTLAEVTPVPISTTDTTPEYTFSSTEAGSITYGGDCSSSILNAVSGNNTITFNTLSLGDHSNCTITVTDSLGNQSATLNVSPFSITSPVNPNPNPTPSPSPNPPSGGGGSGGSGCINCGISNAQTPENSETPSAPSHGSTDTNLPSSSELPLIERCADYVDISVHDRDCPAITYAKKIGALTGYSDKTFRPDMYLSREQSAKTVLNFFDLFEEEKDYCKGKNPFPDVELTMWSSQYICRGSELEIITGYLGGVDAGKFVPGKYVNRAEFITLLFRYLKSHPETQENYQDVLKDSWYEIYSRHAYEKSLFAKPKLFAPLFVTRRDVARIFYKLREVRNQYVSEVAYLKEKVEN